VAGCKSTLKQNKWNAGVFRANALLLEDRKSLSLKVAFFSNML
jgi:hypothetical protein